VASTNATVFVNGIPIHIVGDSWPLHECGEDAHTGVIVSGSSRTFINGKPMSRIGDGIGGVNCASIISGGSLTVFSGG
jgi:uncharacterized Zn-binding protein involved in type VI secretion